MKFSNLLTAGAVLVLSTLTAAQNYPQTSGLQAGYRYLGCYSDRWHTQVADRALGGYFRMAQPMGGSQCITICQSMDPSYIYAGTRDNQCWCDSGLNRNGTTQYGQKLPEAYCSKDCRNNAGQTCGNINTGTTKETGPALSIYTSDTTEYWITIE